MPSSNAQIINLCVLCVVFLFHEQEADTRLLMLMMMLRVLSRKNWEGEKNVYLSMYMCVFNGKMYFLFS